MLRYRPAVEASPSLLHPEEARRMTGPSDLLAPSALALAATATAFLPSRAWR
jgi:hypothetical protein